MYDLYVDTIYSSSTFFQLLNEKNRKRKKKCKFQCRCIGKNLFKRFISKLDYHDALERREHSHFLKLIIELQEDKYRLSYYILSFCDVDWVQFMLSIKDIPLFVHIDDIVDFCITHNLVDEFKSVLKRLHGYFRLDSVLRNARYNKDKHVIEILSQALFAAITSSR